MTQTVPCSLLIVIVPQSTCTCPTATDSAEGSSSTRLHRLRTYYNDVMAVTQKSCPLSRLFLQQAVLSPKAVALKTTEKVVTFAELQTQVSAIKKVLIDRVSNGKPVVAFACTSPEAELCSVLAIVLAGGCFVPVDERMPLAQLRSVMQDAQPHAVLVSGKAAKNTSLRAVFNDSLEWPTVILELDENGRLKDGSLRSCAEGVKDSERDPNKSSGGHSIASAAEIARDHSISLLRREVVTCTQDNMNVDGSNQREPKTQSSSGPALGDATNSSDAFTGAFHDESDLLYLIYTSGTTGTPKGVLGTRSGAMNRIRFGWKEFPYRESGELIARRTPSCFVDFVAEVFSPLLAGMPIFLVPQDIVADPLRLVPALAESGATRVTLTPSLLSSILKTGGSSSSPLLPNLHTWFVSGEALHRDLAVDFKRRTAPGTHLVNLYGSTEVSGDATFCNLDDILQPTPAGASSLVTAVGNDTVDAVSIGRPLPGAYASIVDSDLRPTPMGQPGELIIGGILVALGYHRRPRETAEKFLYAGINIPGLPEGRRAFRTGDKVIQRSEGGPLFWLGRLDSEVKVRGIRVSLNEVERLMCKAARIPSGAAAAVWVPGKVLATRPWQGITRNEPDKPTEYTVTHAPHRGRLLGFITEEGMRQTGCTLSSLRRKFEGEMTAAQLPALLIPTHGPFPLTRTGKVDKRALLEEYRSRTPTAIHAEPTPGSVVGGGDVRNTHLAVKMAVARAIDEVLPDAKETTAAWVAATPTTAVRQQEYSWLSSLTFADLGGTSLLAVEAAWLSSRFLLEAEAEAEANTAATSFEAFLDATDFLQNTLENVVLMLRYRAIAAARRVGGSEADGMELDHKLPNPAHLRPPQKNPQVETTSPSVRTDIVEDDPAFSSSHRGVKRRLEDSNRAVHHTTRRVELPDFIAVGRAGIGLFHTSECLGAPGRSVDPPDRVVAARVDLRSSWSAGMTKCVDATPLVVVAREVNLDICDSSSHSKRASVTVPDHCLDLKPRACCCALGSGSSSTSETLRAGSLPRAGIAASCKLEESAVYIGCHSGEFHALNFKTGKREWSLTLGGRIESGAACSSDGAKVFVGCYNGCLYAIDRKRGTVLWSVETGDVIKSTPVSVAAVEDSVRSYSEALGTERYLGGGGGGGQGVVVVGSHDGVLRCLREADGRLVWKFDCGGAIFASPAHNAQGCTVYAATIKGRLLAIGRSAVSPAEVGSESNKWVQDVPRLHCAAEHGQNRHLAGNPFVLWEHQLPGPCFSTPAVCVTGALVVGCIDGGMYCFSATGDQLWVQRQGQKPVFSSPCLLPPQPDRTRAEAADEVDLNIVWGCHDGKLRCGLSQRLSWEIDIDQGQAVFSSPCFASVECAKCTRPLPLVFACSVSGLLAVVRASDGVKVGQVVLPAEIFSSPVVVGRSLFVGCRDDKVYSMDIVATCSRCTET